MLFDFMEQITKIFGEFIKIKESKSVELMTDRFILNFQKTFVSGKTLSLQFFSRHFNVKIKYKRWITVDLVKGDVRGTKNNL